jgi:hypothetical protein
VVSLCQSDKVLSFIHATLKGCGPSRQTRLAVPICLADATQTQQSHLG